MKEKKQPLRLLVVSPASTTGMPAQGELLCEKLDGIDTKTELLGRTGTKIGRFVQIAFKGFAASARADVVLVNVFGYRSFINEAVAILYGRLFRKRLVVVIRGGWFSTFAERWPRLTKFVLSRADLLVTPHEFLSDKLKSVGISVDRQIPNTIEIDKYEFRRRDGVKPHLLFLRGDHPIYNPEMALRAFAILQEEYPDARLTMAGGEHVGCRRLASQLGLRNVDFVGTVRKSDIPALADSHDLYVQSNRVENFPVTVVEMWACGLPVVATDVGGTPYLVRDEQDGLLVESENPQGLAAACKRLIKSPQLAQRLTVSGRKRAEAYAWRNVKPLWHDALRAA